VENSGHTHELTSYAKSRKIRSMRLPLFLSCAVQLCLLISPVKGEQTWLEVRSPHFRVLTPCGDGDARQVAGEMEKMRYVFTTRFPGARIESGAPLTMYVTCDEDTREKLAPKLSERVAGVFNQGWQKQFALVRMNSWKDHGHEIVFHEYTHSFLHMNAHWLPLWLNEGTAEFYGFTRFEAHRIYLGAPTERYRTLRSKTPLPVEEFITLDQRSPYYRDSDKDQLFYAEAWALVHYLIYGKGMDNGKKFDNFYQMLQQGVDQKKAFLEAFGSFGEVDKDLQSYMLQPTFTTTILKTTPQIDDTVFSVRTLSVAETEAEIATYLLWHHNWELAGPHLDRALREDPKLGLAHENKGFFYFLQGQDDAAAGEFKQAFTLDKKLYLSLYYATMLSPVAAADTPASQNAFRDAMLYVYQLNPAFAPPLVQLSLLTLRQNDLQNAYDLARKAEELEPSLAGYNLLTGEALIRMDRGAETADYAKYVADRWVAGDHNEAVELWNSIPAQQRPAAVSLRLQAPSDSQTAVGTIQAVACGAKGEFNEITLFTDGQPITFHRKDYFGTSFSDTIWYGGDFFSLCHHLEGKRAIVYYRATTDATPARNIVFLEIHEDWATALHSASAQAASPSSH